MFQLKKSIIFDIIVLFLVHIILIFAFIEVDVVERFYHLLREYKQIPLNYFLPFLFSFSLCVICIFLRRRKNASKLSLTEELTAKDPLTKLLNRHTLRRNLVSEWHRFQRYHEDFCIVLFDIDDFSNINDSLGYIEGDRILMDIADMLKNNTRKTDYVARWGEEEFMILCPVCKAEQAAMLAEKLRSSIYRILKDGVELSASFSIVQSSSNRSLEELIKRVHLGLHKAKGRGKNCVVNAS